MMSLSLLAGRTVYVGFYFDSLVYLQVGALVFPPKKLFSKNEKVASERRSQLEVNISSSFRKDIKVNLGDHHFKYYELETCNQ